MIAANPGQAERYRGGKEGLLGFFVGQVMKETGGKADPRVVSERLREKLAGWTRAVPCWRRRSVRARIDDRRRQGPSPRATRS